MLLERARAFVGGERANVVSASRVREIQALSLEDVRQIFSQPRHDSHLSAQTRLSSVGYEVAAWITIFSGDSYRYREDEKGRQAYVLGYSALHDSMREVMIKQSDPSFDRLLYDQVLLPLITVTSGPGDVQLMQLSVELGYNKFELFAIEYGDEQYAHPLVRELPTELRTYFLISVTHYFLTKGYRLTM